MEQQKSKTQENNNNTNTQNNINAYKNITQEDENLIENTPILKDSNCDYFFILNNYGKCASFINEIIQTEGITMYEHLKLKEIMRVNILIFNY